MASIISRFVLEQNKRLISVQKKKKELCTRILIYENKKISQSYRLCPNFFFFFFFFWKNERTILNHKAKFQGKFTPKKNGSRVRFKMHGLSYKFLRPLVGPLCDG